MDRPSSYRSRLPLPVFKQILATVFSPRVLADPGQGAPGNPSLAGVTFYNQAWVIDGKANTFGIGTSNGGKGGIGY